MNDSNTNRKLSRRKVLGSLGVIGGAGALAGGGTSALFSDRESAAVSFTSGELDLTVHYTSRYEGATTQTDSGEIDGNQAVLFDRKDLKPGDSGKTKFCFELHTNPAYLWLCGGITADGEGSSHSQLEQEAGDQTKDDGELDEKIQATLRYCDSEGNLGEVIVGSERSTLRDVLDEFENGIPLDFGGDRDASPGNQTAYDPGETTGPCVCIEWNIPESVGNEIQTDELAFTLTFHAVQARHNDGTGSPCGEGDGGGGGNPNRKAISFVAFCYSGDEPEIGVTITETKDGGEPLGIEWNANPAVDGVALKTGGGRLAFENFPGGTSGTATVGNGKPPRDGQTPPDPCPNGKEVKFEYKGASGSFERE